MESLHYKPSQNPQKYKKLVPHSIIYFIS